MSTLFHSIHTFLNSLIFLDHWTNCRELAPSTHVLTLFIPLRWYWTRAAPNSWDPFGAEVSLPLHTGVKKNLFIQHSTYLEYLVLLLVHVRHCSVVTVATEHTILASQLESLFSQKETLRSPSLHHASVPVHISVYPATGEHVCQSSITMELTHTNILTINWFCSSSDSSPSARLCDWRRRNLASRIVAPSYEK